MPLVHDWTLDQETGRTNSSAEFTSLVKAVERIILNSGHDLLHGRAEAVARVIMAQLAHEHCLAPEIKKK